MAEFTFTGEQQQLRAAVRKFCAESFAEATVRRLMESEVRYDPAVWRRLGAELGVLGMSVPEADGERVITHALQIGSALLAVEQVGAAQHMLDLSVDYAKSRLQFGRHIGSFQAVKHKLADMLVDLEHARSTAYHAVWALADGSDDPALAVSIAQATCSAAFSRIAADGIQVHGGIGFTWEHQAHLYFKRAATDAALLGSAEQHRGRIAALVLDTAIVDEPPRVAAGIA